jgi:hypothetical protein
MCVTVAIPDIPQGGDTIAWFASLHALSNAMDTVIQVVRWVMCHDVADPGDTWSRWSGSNTEPLVLYNPCGQAGGQVGDVLWLVLLIEVRSQPR